MKRHFLLTVLAAGLATGSCSAQAPAPIGQIISYSGKLTNTDGTPIVDGQKVLGIKLYADGGEVEGFAQSPTVFTVGGVFTTFLQYNGINFDPTKKYELGVTAPGQTELKMPLSSVPVAQVAATVPDGAITSRKLKPTIVYVQQGGDSATAGGGYATDVTATINVDVPSTLSIIASTTIRHSTSGGGNMTAIHIEVPSVGFTSNSARYDSVGPNYNVPATCIAAVPVPAGTHQIQLRHSPYSILQGRSLLVTATAQ